MDVPDPQDEDEVAKAEKAYDTAYDSVRAAIKSGFAPDEMIDATKLIAMSGAIVNFGVQLLAVGFSPNGREAVQEIVQAVLETAGEEIDHHLQHNPHVRFWTMAGKDSEIKH